MRCPSSDSARVLQAPGTPVSSRGSPLGRRSALWWAGLLLPVLLLAHLATPGASRGEFSPESPEVKSMVKQGLAFLEQHAEPQPGGEALIGLTFLKSGAPASHPRVQQSLAAVRKSLESERPFGEEMYTPCIELLFFSALDPQGHRAEINKVFEYMVGRQKTHGGWGYVSRLSGDTSMTQYAVLAMWELSQQGIEAPVEAWERVANWLLRTQDPSGAFGYQGKDPGGFQRVAQTEVRASMVVAGLGSVYICAHHLGLDPRQASDNEISSTLARVEKGKSPRRRRLTAKVDTSKIAAAQRDGDQWMQANYAINPRDVPYLHYYLYTLERYESFRELDRGVVEQGYTWYDDGVRLLMRSQATSGSWKSQDSEQIDTAFAILFLLRSTQKSLGKAGLLGAGTLVGGRGLPKDLSTVQMRDGAVVAKPLAGPAEKLLSLLDDPADPAYLSAVEGFRELTLEADEATLNKQAVRLRQLAGSEAPEARLAAVVALARARDLDNVPTLIYALSDPDAQIVNAALEGLRFVSRKFQGLGDGPIKDEPSRRAAIERWKNWYRTVRPEATFDRE